MYLPMRTMSFHDEEIRTITWGFIYLLCLIYNYNSYKFLLCVHVNEAPESNFIDAGVM